MSVCHGAGGRRPCPWHGVGAGWPSRSLPPKPFSVRWAFTSWESGIVHQPHVRSGNIHQGVINIVIKDRSNKGPCVAVKG